MILRFLRMDFRNRYKTPPASKVSKAANKLGSTVSDAITKTPNAMAIIRICAGIPSRYIGIRNAVYTSASPNSCCKIDKAAGSKTIAVASNCDLVFLKTVSGRERYLANARAAKILQSSAGCKLNPPPKGIQLFEPLMFLPITKVASISKIPKAYNKLAKAVNSLLSVNRINIPTTPQKTANKICLL